MVRGFRGIHWGGGRAPWIIFIKNVSFRQNNKNSSDIDEARRRGHGESCFTFQIVYFKSYRKKTNEQIVLDRPYNDLFIQIGGVPHIPFSLNSSTGADH